ncbi:hypothetical protein [Flexivirga caeni]|nr:hypothetical protein [Flexivirga caeni]
MTKTRSPNCRFFPQSVVNGGKIRNDAGTGRPVIRDMISTRSSGVV